MLGNLYMTASGVVCYWDLEVLENYIRKCRQKGLQPPYPVKILAGPELEGENEEVEVAEPDS